MKKILPTLYVAYILCSLGIGALAVFQSSNIPTSTSPYSITFEDTEVPSLSSFKGTHKPKKVKKIKIIRTCGLFL